VATSFGLQLRHPLLDHRLFELAARLPSTACYRAGYHKLVLRQLMRQRLPESVSATRDKTVPVALFHRGVRGEGRSKVWPLLHDMRADALGLVDQGRLRRAFQRYLDGEDDFTFWRAASLEDWLRRHF